MKRASVVQAVPNLLSLARALSAPFFFYLLYHREYRAAFFLVFIAGWTDIFDGYLARKLNVSSRFGAYADPVADKLLLAGSYVTLALSGAIDRWLAVLVLGRDVMILGFVIGALLFSKKLRNFPPSIWGKLSSLAQILYIGGFLMYQNGWLFTPLLQTYYVVHWAVVALTSISGLDYIRLASRMLRRLD